MFELAQQSDVFQPVEAFFDPFPLLLADGVAGMPRASMALPPGRAVFCATCGVTFISGIRLRTQPCQNLYRRPP